MDAGIWADSSDLMMFCCLSAGQTAAAGHVLGLQAVDAAARRQRARGGRTEAELLNRKRFAGRPRGGGLAHAPTPVLIMHASASRESKIANLRISAGD